MTIIALIFQKCSMPTTSASLNGTWICLVPLKSQPCISSLLWATFATQTRLNKYVFTAILLSELLNKAKYDVLADCKNISFKQMNKVYVYAFTPKWKHELNRISWGKKWRFWFLPSPAHSSPVPAQAQNQENSVIATPFLCISWSCQVAPAVYCAAKKEAQLLLLLSTKTDSLAHSAPLEL